ncbi:hypothetical protein [Nonomuraea sp. CA-141351]|uniref:hypothetical protein n=1 Tax=Nonomuraea sp. CA-141351 TaxID=3239996 RepID=UPI003D8A2DFE
MSVAYGGLGLADEIHGAAEGRGSGFQVREDHAPVRGLVLVHVDLVLFAELAGELANVLGGLGQLVQHGPDAHPAGGAVRNR